MYLDCNAIGYIVKIFPRVPSTCAQNAILSLLIIYIILSRQIYVASDNPLHVLSVSFLTTSRHRWNDVHTADDISQAEILQSKGCQGFSHLCTF